MTIKKKNQPLKTRKSALFKTVLYLCVALALLGGIYYLLESSEDGNVQVADESGEASVAGAKENTPRAGNLRPRKSTRTTVNINQDENTQNDEPREDVSTSTNSSSTVTDATITNLSQTTDNTTTETPNLSTTINNNSISVLNESTNSVNTQQTSNTSVNTQEVNNSAPIASTQQATNLSSVNVQNNTATASSTDFRSPSISPNTINISVNTTSTNNTTSTTSRSYVTVNTVQQISPTTSNNSRLFTPASSTSTNNSQNRTTPIQAQTLAADQVQNPEFFVAIESDNVDLIKNLIDRKIVDWRTKNSQGYNALHYAAVNLKLGVLRYLLEKVVPVDKVDKFSTSGHTALQLVCSSDKAEALEAATLLLNHNAGVNKTKSEPSAEMMTPLFLAVERGNVDLVKFLLEKGANANQILKDSNESVLHYAMRTCKRTIIKDLLDKGADVNVANGHNRLPIHEAAALGCVEGLRELILTRRISKDTLSPASSENKCKQSNPKLCLYKATPLHYAAKEKKMEVVEFLVLIQASQFIKDEKKKRAETYAAGRDLMKYFEDQKEFEKRKLNNHDVENLMRYCETLSTEDSLDFYNYLTQRFLHKHNANASVDDMTIPRLSETELRFIKSNVTGMDNFTVNSRSGNDLLVLFFCRRATTMPDTHEEIAFAPGLGKNFMKILALNTRRINF